MRRHAQVFVFGAAIVLSGTIVFAALTTAPQPPDRTHSSIGVQEVDSLEVRIIDRQGQPIGSAHLTRDTAGVRVRARVESLSPGGHGVHIHSRGACDPPRFTSAGPHYQPESRSHGFLDSRGPHAGDLPMLHVNAEGVGENYDFTTGLVRLDRESLLSSQGSAVIIHAKPDDYLTDTGGGSGDRIACGVISPSGPEAGAGQRRRPPLTESR